MECVRQYVSCRQGKNCAPLQDDGKRGVPLEDDVRQSAQFARNDGSALDGAARINSRDGDCGTAALCDFEPGAEKDRRRDHEGRIGLLRENFVRLALGFLDFGHPNAPVTLARHRSPNSVGHVHCSSVLDQSADQALHRHLEDGAYHPGHFELLLRTHVQA